MTTRVWGVTQLTQTPLKEVPGGTIPEFRAFHALLKGGALPAVAAAEIGVDPLLGKMWAALPADWFGPLLEPHAEPQVPTASGALGPPVTELSRNILVRVPAGGTLESGVIVRALEQASQSPAALSNAIHAAKQGGYYGRTRAYTLPGTLAYALCQVAEDADVDVALLAGHLLAGWSDLEIAWWPKPDATPRTPRWTGVRAPAALPRRRVVGTNDARRRAKREQLAAMEDDAPSGEQLAARRNALGISQRALAKVAGLSRGLCAEIERGRRRHVGTRVKMADTLARLEGERLLLGAKALLVRAGPQPGENAQAHKGPERET